MTNNIHETRFKLADENFEFEKWPFYNMSRLISLYHRRLDSALKPLGLDATRWRILSILSKRKTASVTEIAEESTALLSTTAKAIQRMVAQGLLQTRTSTRDARSIQVNLSDKGKTAFTDAERKVSLIASRAFHGVDESEIDALNFITRRIYGNLEL